MTKYNTLNVKLSSSQRNKLKSAIKNGTEVTLNLSSKLIGDSNDKTNFPSTLLLTDTQVSKICNAFANGSSANIKFSKTQLAKMIQSGGFMSLVPLYGSSDPPFRKTFSSAKSLAESLTNSYAKELKNTGSKKLDENTLVDAGLSLLGKKIFKNSSFTGSGITLTNDEIKDIIKVFKK